MSNELIPLQPKKGDKLNDALQNLRIKAGEVGLSLRNEPDSFWYKTYCRELGSPEEKEWFLLRANEQQRDAWKRICEAFNPGSLIQAGWAREEESKKSIRSRFFLKARDLFFSAEESKHEQWIADLQPIAEKIGMDVTKLRSAWIPSATNKSMPTGNSNLIE